MAGEIQASARLKVLNGSLNFDLNTGTLSVDQAASGGPTPGYQTIGTTEESNTFGELSSAGWLIMQNLDATNYVEWGFSTGVYGGKMKAGEFALFRVKPGLTLYLKANTAACKVVIYALES